MDGFGSWRTGAAGHAHHARHRVRADGGGPGGGALLRHRGGDGGRRRVRRPGEAAPPYTRALWRALPGSGFTPLPGFQPAAGELPPGCAFAPRCGQADTACGQERPPLRELRGGTVRCVHAT
ncbi:oligopeptide/dipeptide ABC transporter ATP-binding protein [Paenibacillus mucilaginosus]|uniref:oligopeptide/dipeptide ABC transporter ATP-binding protein n=1 Tax=Paenibacillus mucilaginosus TaxID=61624 RepID=UPI003B983444